MTVFKKFKELNSKFLELEKERYRMIDEEIMPLLEFGSKITVEIDERELEVVTFDDTPRIKLFNAVVLDWIKDSAEVLVSLQRGGCHEGEKWIGFENIVRIGWEKWE